MMNALNGKLKYKPFIQSLELDADDWGLFTASMDCDKVAEKLNHTFVACVNNGFDRNQTRARMDHIMHLNSKFGAADSEPSHKLDELLETVFGTATAR